MDSQFILKQDDIKKGTFTQILIEIYNNDDLNNVINFCKNYNYKGIYILHKAEKDEEKEHIHFLIKSDSHHRFHLCSLISDTLVYYNFAKCKTASTDFCKYVLHLDYDTKIKYQFSDIKFINYKKEDIKRIEMACLFNTDFNTLDEELYNKQTLLRMLFNCQFTSFQEIIQFCNHSYELQNYFVRNNRQIRECFESYFISMSREFKDKSLLKDIEYIEYRKERNIK